MDNSRPTETLNEPKGLAAEEPYLVKNYHNTIKQRSNTFHRGILLALPVEIIGSILSFIPVEELFWDYGVVCKTFLAEACQILKKANVQVKLPNNDFAKNFEWICSCKDMAIAVAELGLDLSYNETLTDSQMKSIVYKCSALKILNLSFCQLTNEGIKYVSNLPHLEQLNLSACRIVDDCTLTTVVHGCMKLRELELLMCENITDEGMQAIGMNCEELTNLNIIGCYLVTDIGLKFVSGKCPKLKELFINGNNKCLTDIGIQSVAEDCHHIRQLTLSQCHWVTDSGIAYIANNCKYLESLSLTGCSKITDSGIMAISNGCPNLNELDLFLCELITDTGIECLANNCKELTQINLFGCSISDRGIISLGQNSKKLEDLSLGSCYRLTRQNLKITLTDVGLKAIAGCKYLKHLSVSACEPITDFGVEFIGKNCKYLETLNLFRCKNLTDSGIKAIASGCSLLKVINLTESVNLGDDGIIHMVEKCHHLKELNLCGCNRLTNNSLIAIGQHCNNLFKLNLTDCKKISDTGIQSFSNNCKLNVLHLSGCDLLTGKGILTMLSSCGSLKELWLQDCRYIVDWEISEIREEYSNLIIWD